jgi:hypothetical protein
MMMPLKGIETKNKRNVFPKRPAARKVGRLGKKKNTDTEKFQRFCSKKKKKKRGEKGKKKGQDSDWLFIDI